MRIFRRIWSTLVQKEHSHHVQSSNQECFSDLWVLLNHANGNLREPLELGAVVQLCPSCHALPVELHECKGKSSGDLAQKRVFPSGIF